MKNIFFRRILAFCIDFFVWVGLFYSWIALNPFIFNNSNVALTTTDVYYVMSFVFIIFFYYLLTSWLFNGFSVGNFIFRLKIVSVVGDHISFKQALLRVFLLTLDILSFFVLNFNNKKKNGYQSFVEKYSDTACVSYSISKENYPHPITKNEYIYGVLTFILLAVFIFIGISYMVVEDFKQGQKEIKSEFIQMINKNLADNNLNNADNNKLIPDCVWHKDEQVAGFPFFVIKLYWADDKSRKNTLEFVNELFSECVQEVYTSEELKASKKTF